ncbi:MAG: hypothetical protein WBQ95_13845 [Terracidiphilus sp.]
MILGVGKLLAIAAILTPQTRLLREWAYAGRTFDLMGAFMVMRDPLRIAFIPLLVLGLAAGSYFLRADSLDCDQGDYAAGWHHTSAMS